MTIRLARSLLLILPIFLAACEVGPDFASPPAPDVAGYTPEPLAAGTSASSGPVGQSQHFVTDGDIPGQWWTLFHSKRLNTLIGEALKANPTLTAAEASLRQAQENAAAAGGSLFPALSGGISAEREKISGIEYGAPSAASSIFSVTTASLSISYPLDVFGGERRQIESLEAQADTQKFELEAGTLTLTANVVTTAVAQASLRAQILATKDIVKLETEQLGILKQQFDLGGVSKADILAQQATLAATIATLPSLQKQLAQTRTQLTTLIGKFPSQDDGKTFDLADLRLPVNLPVSLPSKLVGQRPDIRAADATLHTASAAVGVAIANELPQFTITGTLGSTAGSFAQLFTPGTGIWSLAGGILQPLFDGGTLLHKERAAQAAYDQAAAQYKATVIAAFQNVADALRALETDADSVKAQESAANAAHDSLALAQDQFKLGAIGYPLLLDAQRTYQQARILLVQAEAARYSDTAALFQALGGGWWNRGDDAAVQAGAKNLGDISPIQSIAE